ncbi:MAG TPA: DUF2970 domain-containing protein [Chromatiales bacterium]|nr:DUF2970 domain-containing protein [Thiotrichales bacterium]HIP68628.1 DUF2970 domain-containing protein [Chromatiales bacterium]
MNDKGEAKPIRLIDVFKSVISAFFGVQSSKNRERDFQHGKPWHYIVVGLLMTGIFLLLIWGLVSLVLNLAVSN